MKHILTLAALATLGACAGTPMNPFMQDSLPDAVKVPAGHRVAMETVGVGEITYECKAKAQSPAQMAADQYEWVFAGPKAALLQHLQPATQLAVAPAGAGNIPLQLVKANPAMGQGAMTGVTHIQRVATKGGVAPALPCASGNAGQKQVVAYQADYIFWKAAM